MSTARAMALLMPGEWRPMRSTTEKTITMEPRIVLTRVTNETAK